MQAKRAFFDHIAKLALEEYDIEDFPITFLQHSDNITYRVGGPRSTNYLLRIHVPVAATMGTHGADPAAINSELLWLEALQRNTDLVLQKPMRNRTEEFITQIYTRKQSAPFNCTLLRWVEGQPYHRGLETEETAYQIGVILAKLHGHASQWVLPRNFKRPKRDCAYFESALGNLWPAVQDGRIHKQDFAVLERSVTSLVNLMSALDQGPQNHGIMHADSHKGNLIIYKGNIRLIDFSFCATGNYMFDLGVCLSDMEETLHNACLEGYQSLRALPEHFPRLIEGFFVGSIIGTFSYWAANPHAQEILSAKVPGITRNFAVKFNQGENFWFST